MGDGLGGNFSKHIFICMYMCVLYTIHIKQCEYPTYAKIKFKIIIYHTTLQIEETLEITQPKLISFVH